MTTHYHILNVPPRATLEQIKMAHRDLARKHHPDRGGDQYRSAQINVAYDCLADETGRKVYDLLNKISGQCCVSCDGHGATTRQKGFKSTMPEPCKRCGGSGFALSAAAGD